MWVFHTGVPEDVLKYVGAKSVSLPGDLFVSGSVGVLYLTLVCVCMCVFVCRR